MTQPIAYDRWSDREWSIDAWTKAQQSHAMCATLTSKVADLETEIEELRSIVLSLAEQIIAPTGG